MDGLYDRTTISRDEIDLHRCALVLRRRKAGGAAKGNSGRDTPQHDARPACPVLRSSASLSCRSAASRTGVPSSSVTRSPGLSPARPNPFWTLVPRRPSHPQPRPAAPSWPRARLPCAPLPAVWRAVPRSPPASPARYCPPCLVLLRHVAVAASPRRLFRPTLRRVRQRGGRAEPHRPRQGGPHSGVLSRG